LDPSYPPLPLFCGRTEAELEAEAEIKLGFENISISKRKNNGFDDADAISRSGGG